MSEAKVVKANPKSELSALKDVINLDSWADSLVNKTDYQEPDPEYLSRKLIMQTLTAATPDEVFNGSGIDGLQKMVPDAPGQGTGPIAITDIYVARSNLNEGSRTYLIITYVSLETGKETTTTTGATQVQAQLLRLIGFGQWPIKCQIKRTERKDRGGRHLFWVFPSD